ncbi:siderophore-interacting protein [Streptomyces inusitatus]|uniref:Siderophore-interacting protein n=1 Tax=Streptomyces inusitatus TaxID=68221 RepID=A0A918QHQ9_9ACTN|nr:helix-turn-helix domain-containing protein [Streptomyces inusitatus]GGZ50787.1 siderophore-interacting protein [Streptomyces inusitatus]
MHPSDTADTAPRPEIALSWRRSELSGLTPAAPEIRVDPDAVDRRGRLATAAGPVLTELADQLGDASFCVVLADRASRIVAPTVGPRGLRDRLEGLGVVAGGVFLEETTGTNSIATVYEVRRGLAVHGDEHYLEPFKRFSCYGHPIIHPVTRRLEGVLDITCLTGDGSPLLGPFLARAAHDIEERLLRTTRAAEQRLLAAFQVAAAGRTLPLLVLGEGVVLANPAAVELLDPLDHLLLRELAAGLRSRDGTGPARRVELVSGRSVEVRPRSLGPGAGGVLFEFTVPAETRSTPAPALALALALARPGARSRSDTPVYIGGAPGTGRTTKARSLAGTDPRPPVVLDSSEAAVRGEAAWLRDLGAAAGARSPLLVEEVQLLPEACAVRLRHLLERPDAPRIVLTGAPAGDLDGPGAALAAACAGRIELAPLRDRTEELPGLVRAVLDELGADPGPRFTPAALAALAGHPWPGNLRELRAVVRAVLERRSAGDVTPGDLPEGYRVSPRLRRMTPLERAEHDTIAAALRACGGNKLRAARRLGISRTTLYNRMRALHIIF